MDEDRDYILDIGGHGGGDEGAMDSGEEESAGTDSKGRPYICVHFDCCSVYSRIYKNREGTAYVGWCPKCARKISVKVGTNGTDCRFFRAE